MWRVKQLLDGFTGQVLLRGPFHTNQAIAITEGADSFKVLHRPVSHRRPLHAAKIPTCVLNAKEFGPDREEVTQFTFEGIRFLSSSGPVREGRADPGLVRTRLVANLLVDGQACASHSELPAWRLVALWSPWG